ncbi:MAG: MOSC domain-containing protein [Candidatus Eisenbacteria bacterium]|uniref:MOSC domain-containing protein n=1 Tax=Eiseniibacteriota bacterium TaxID=2212470 RepID=A0A956NHK8_UNCEI|nr:MOSC domain-containing protein [Candidatus Eisenbacteria bacterium]MCB9465454.1 MOSC domain-containing protein [Candidatus Eisenbacteria bacterium]
MEHHVLRLWYRPAPGATPIEVQSLDLVAGQGVDLDHTRGSMRHVTIVFEDDWRRAAEEAGDADLDPVGRRANVLLSGGGGQGWIKQWVRLGPSLFEVKGVTAPCGVMDEFHQGLKDALEPEARAGVWGRLHASGTLRVGDVWNATEERPAPQSRPS